MSSRLFLFLFLFLALLAWSFPQGIRGQEVRHLPPVAPPAAFREALDRGTRSPDGRPGPAYWQQRADYRIDARLDPASGRVTGRETLTYRNRSPDRLVRLVLHLDQNVYAPGARRNRRAPVTGGVELGEVRVDGEVVEARHPGGGYQEALTLLEVPLPDELEPGASVDVELAWSFVVPPAPTFRNGNLDGEVFAVAQWYPRMAVYDDVYGWDLTPYLGDGEFYLEYGNFDVRLTVPEGWLVGATGTLENAAEVLTEETRARLEAAGESDSTVHVVPSDRRGPGVATVPSADGTLTWHFTARDVRDFAWSTSPRYVWDARATAGGALAQAFYRPDHEAWSRAAEWAAFTVETLSDWIGPYPYPRITMTEGPVGGMEYPMVVFASGNSPRGVAGVTIHEVAHMWFPMSVGSMEAKHAWMDEGIVSYFDETAARVLWGEDAPRWGENGAYLRVAGREAEVPLMRHTDLVSPYGARTLAAYTKPAVVLGALREVLGEDVFRDAFQDYFASWRFRHPQPWDFFATMERHAGRDLDWFWGPLFFGTGVLDQAVASVEPGAEGTRIIVEDRGGVVLPTPVRVELADGRTMERRIPAERWLSEGRRVAVEVPGRAVAVELDPGRLFPDVDRTNDVWREGGGS